MNIFSPHRPTRASPERERAVRRRIVAHLNESIKVVLHEFGDAEGAVGSCESANELCRALEALFIHGLRDTFLELVSSALRDTRLPEPNFWPPLLVVTHRAVLTQLGELSQIRTDIGKCRAWLRTALNDGLLASYLAMVAGDRRLLGYHYEKWALLRDREQVDIVLSYLKGLEPLAFELATNSSLLNAWEEAPLELAGLFFRPRQLNVGAVTTGQDVAASLAEPAPQPQPPDGCRLPRPDGATLILNALDPDMAFDVIMRSSSSDDLSGAGTPPQPQPQSPPPPPGSGCSSEASSLAGEVARLTSAPPPPPPPPESYISVLESYRENSPRARSLMQTPDVHFLLGRSVGSSSPGGSSGSSRCQSAEPDETPSATDADGKEPPPEPSKTPAAEPPAAEPDGRPPAAQAELADEPAAADSPEPEEPRLRWFSEIATERGLDGQNYTCGGCSRFVGMLYGQPRLCRFDALFYCSDCHTGDDLLPLPARMAHNWDFARYPVARRNRELLERLDGEPLINVADVNLNVYDVSADMERVRLHRTRLVFLRAFLKTCRSSAADELDARVAGRQHLIEHVHLYASVDLREVKVGSLGRTLLSLVEFAQGHVLACSLCSQKGFVCEFCRDSQIIYPFELETTRQCRQCFGLYHSRCWRRPAPCPRCERYRRRAELRRLLEEPRPGQPPA